MYDEIGQEFQSQYSDGSMRENEVKRPEITLSYN